MIPWASPLAQYRAQEAEIRAAIDRVLESGAYILGEEVEAFERAFADHCGVAYAVGVGSGTDALILAMKGLGIGPGDEVITVSHTALATVAAVLAAGAVPVLVDIEPGYHTVDPVLAEAAVTSRTKAIIAVHLYGQAADMAALVALARRRGLFLIEDCAQSSGGASRGARSGSQGHIGCFSFYPTKNLGGIGDGGMVVTSGSALSARVRRLRQYGWDADRNAVETGLNSRLDPLQAAILGVKLPALDRDTRRRGVIAERYRNGLRGLPIGLPTERPDAVHAYHLFVVEADDRDALRRALMKDGIGSAVHYPVPAHRQPGYANRVRLPAEGLPRTDSLVDRILSLPLYPQLDDAEVDSVIASIRRHFGQG